METEVIQLPQPSSQLLTCSYVFQRSKLGGQKCTVRLRPQQQELGLCKKHSNLKGTTNVQVPQEIKPSTPTPSPTNVKPIIKDENSVEVIKLQEIPISTSQVRDVEEINEENEEPLD